MATSAPYGSDFEDEVLRVARLLWGQSDPYQGSAMIDGRERDGVFIGEDLVVIIEATTSRTLEKAKKDGDKLRELFLKVSEDNPFKAIKAYFVTQDEPTADQRKYIAELDGVNVFAMSYSQLRSLLIDSPEYLAARSRYPFGSAKNLETGDVSLLEEYIPMELLEDPKGRSRTHSIEKIARSLVAGNSVILVGDFGAGKSMTTREIHRHLKTQHIEDRRNPFPLTLNLRDHQSQSDPEEAIRRHCNLVGFESPSRLVQAWRAGEVVVLLDGFDEIATSGWLGRATALKQIRHRSVELIRRFSANTPQKAGVYVTGRRHLFDDNDEMKSALGMEDRDPVILYADEFSEEQISQYLSNHGWTGGLPDWLPARPLLLGTLASFKIIDGLVGEDDLSPAQGWDRLLESICKREAAMEMGLDGDTVRRIIERLATIARPKSDGLGPLYQDEMAQAFEEICNYAPDEGAYVIIQRLPGLGIMDPGDGSRYFIDNDLADAARAGDVVRLVAEARDEIFTGLSSGAKTLGGLGINLAAAKLQDNGFIGDQLAGIGPRLNNKGITGAVVLDVVQIALTLGIDTTLPVINISGVEIEHLAFADGQSDANNVVISESIIDLLDLSEFDGNYKLPRFWRCEFNRVLGAGSPDALPAETFQECNFESFDSATQTTHGILSMPGLNDRQKVLLSILKKVYLQPGGTRRRSALVRGLKQSQAELVPAILEELTSEGLLTKSRGAGHELYSSTRNNSRRVQRMLESGVSGNDPLMG